MKKITKSALIAFALMVLTIAIHVAEVRTERVNTLTEAFKGLSRIPYGTLVISVNPM